MATAEPRETDHETAGLRYNISVEVWLLRKFLPRIDYETGCLLATTWIWLFCSFCKNALLPFYKSCLPSHLANTSSCNSLTIFLNLNMITKYWSSGFLVAFCSLWTLSISYSCSTAICFLIFLFFFFFTVYQTPFEKLGTHCRGPQ